MISPEPNTNLLCPRTVLPMLHADLEAGDSVLLCAVYADIEDRQVLEVPKEVLEVAKSL